MNAAKGRPGVFPGIFRLILCPTGICRTGQAVASEPIVLQSGIIGCSGNVSSELRLGEGAEVLYQHGEAVTPHSSSHTFSPLFCSLSSAQGTYALRRLSAVSMTDSLIYPGVSTGPFTLAAASRSSPRLISSWKRG